jgi:hypothetical protein
MSQQMFTFTFEFQSINTILMTPAVWNIDATSFQHTGTLYILWLSMKMDVSTALQLILSKMLNPCLTMSLQIRGIPLFLLSMTRELKEHLQTSITVTFHRTSRCPPRTHTAVSQLHMDNVGYNFTNLSIATISASIKSVTSHRYVKLGRVSVLLQSTSGGV